jgi:hypothetical protein
MTEPNWVPDTLEWKASDLFSMGFIHTLEEWEDFVEEISRAVQLYFEYQDEINER